MFQEDPNKTDTYLINGVSYKWDGRGYYIVNQYEEDKSSISKKGIYTDTIYRADAIYLNDYIQLKQTPLLYDVKNLVIRNSFGDIKADVKIVYNNSYAWIYSELLSKTANWELFTIEYDLIVNDKTYPPDLKGKIGRNYVQDEDQAGYHSNNDTNHFLSVYHQFGGTERQALKSQEIQNADISWSETDEWAVKAKFNIVGRPYVQGATAEEISSCPDILSIGSHYGNYYYTGAIAAGNHGVLNADPLLNIGDRKDITENENTFLKNTIAITCGEKLDGTGLWCSYGYGVEFFEAMEGLVERYPEKNIYAARALMFSIDARTLTTTANTGWVTRNNDQVGDKIYLHGETIQEAIITEIVDASTVKIDRDITIASPGVYMWNYCYLQNLTGTQPQQSATCSWVAAKLALIQDFTDANWQLVREAARMTASNSTMVETGGVKVYTTHWDMKRGFGMIDVTKAVEYIEDNYINNQEYKDSVIPSLPVYNPFLKVDDLDDNNPITKKQLLEAIAITQYADEFGDIIIHPNLLIAKYTDTFGDILI